LCFLRPWIGVLVFAWLGYMNPHRLLGGFAYNMPFAKLVAAATLLGLVRTKDRAAPARSVEIYLLIALWITFVCSTVFAARHPEIARAKFLEISKILVMTGVTVVLCQERRKLHALLLVIALSIGFYGLTGGLRGLLTRWPDLLWGPPDSAIGDNNALAFALTMVLPFFVFLRYEEPRPWLRHTLLAMFGLSVVAVYATYSRGGLIGLCVVLVVLTLKRRTQDLAFLAVTVAAVAAVGLAPPRWFERMRTITPWAYRDDASGHKRMMSWYVAFHLGL